MKLSRQHPEEPARQAETAAVGLGDQKAVHAHPEAFKALAQAPSVRGLATMMSVGSGATAVPDYAQPAVDLGIEESPKTPTKAAIRDQLAYQCFLVTMEHPIPRASGKSFGLRVVDEASVSVGSILPPSRRWDFNVPTDEMVEGTSVIGLGNDPIQSRVRHALRGMRIYSGKTLLVVRGDIAGPGEDEDEMEMVNCEVLAVFRRSTGERIG